MMTLLKSLKVETKVFYFQKLSTISKFLGRFVNQNVIIPVQTTMLMMTIILTIMTIILMMIIMRRRRITLVANMPISLSIAVGGGGNA